MDIELVKPKGICKTVREAPCAHKPDADFESSWPVGDGYLKRIRLRPGLDLYIMDYEPENGLEMSSLAWPSGFGFKFFISGEMKYQNCAVKDEMVMTRGLNRFSFFPVSRGSGKSLSRDRVKVVTVSMAPSFFFTLFRDEHSRLTDVYDPAKSFYHIRPNTPTMEAAARAIFNCTFHGSLKKVFFESKALELAACQLSDFTQPEQDHRISGEEREKVELAREILSRHMDAPPSFLSLAQMVGLPHNRLSSGFQAVYGHPPFTLLRDIRLEKSRGMLEEKKEISPKSLWMWDIPP